MKNINVLFGLFFTICLPLPVIAVKLKTPTPHCLTQIHFNINNCDPELIRSSQAIKNYVNELCNILDVSKNKDLNITLNGAPNLNEGYCFCQFTQDGMISGKFINAKNSLSLFIYYSKVTDCIKAEHFSHTFFKADKRFRNFESALI